jgi:CspA family cold shock protein
MNTGKVKFFNEAKGQEIFVHVTGLVDKIREADNVSFEITEGKKGLNAINVKKI